MERRPRSEGWARPGRAPRGFGVWVPCIGRLLLQAGWQEEEALMRGGEGRGGGMSNAMSHSALAVWEGDKRGWMGRCRKRILLHVV